MHRSPATSHLLWMVVFAGPVFVAGAVAKAPCATDRFAERGDASIPCYTDTAALLEPEQLAGGRVPYLDPCVPSSRPCDEYPVLTMATMVVAARPGSHGWFFAINAAVMLVCACITVWALERMGARTLLFAAAPALALYGPLNWDLLAVAAGTVATMLLLRGRDVASGIALGIGAAAKLYPALMVGPFAWHRASGGKQRQAVALGAGAVVTWGVLNVPFAIGGTEGWLEVFRYNSARGVDYESVWQIPCRAGMCPSASIVNALSVLLVVAGTYAAWRSATNRAPDEPRWFSTFPLLVMVVVTGKFWSPQYALWLLPWFALSRLPVRVWLAYQISEVLEFIARTGFMSGDLGATVPLSWLLFTVALRAALLLRCLWWWTRDPEPTPGVAERAASLGAMAALA